MRHLTISMFSCVLALVTGSASAGDMPACALPASAQAIVRVAQLPADVQSLLRSNGPVSDPGGPFNPGDVVAEFSDPVPGQRLVSGQAGMNVICLRVEQGGRGLRHAVMRFERNGARWTLVSQTNELPATAR